MKNRLSKCLASAGVASRRHAEEIIFEGRVKVNGTTVTVPQTPVDLSVDRVEVDGTRVKGVEEKLYFLLNKPVGYICSAVRPGQKRIVLDLIPSKARLFTVGRLDQETSGLLLITNDGHFANRVIHPSSNIPKEYLVKVDQEVTHSHLVVLMKGALVDDKWVRPVSVTKVRRGTFKVVVKEGKKHEVRILCEKADLKVVELTRTRIGNLSLGALPVGSFRPLSAEDKKMLLQEGVS